MGFSKTEVNFRRLLAAAPQQQNHPKLVHYIATLREQLEQLVAETTPEGLPRISKAKVNDYSEKIEALAAKLAAQPVYMSEIQNADANVREAHQSYTLESSEADVEALVKESPSKPGEAHVSSPRLRRRLVSQTKVENRTHEAAETDLSTPVKLDVAAHAHIEKHRKLQEDLTDEMVGLAQQLKESSLMMSQSVEDTEKILDSTERAVEHSLASTGHANTRAMEIYSESFKTTCFTWLIIFVMTCIFIMVVLLIRVT